MTGRMHCTYQVLQCMYNISPAVAILLLHRFTTYGAMVGGPSNTGGLAYTDSRDDTYQFSEPSFDYQVRLHLTHQP